MHTLSMLGISEPRLSRITLKYVQNDNCRFLQLHEIIEFAGKFRGYDFVFITNARVAGASVIDAYTGRTVFTEVLRALVTEEWCWTCGMLIMSIVITRMVHTGSCSLWRCHSPILLLKKYGGLLTHFALYVTHIIDLRK